MSQNCNMNSRFKTSRKIAAWIQDLKLRAKLWYWKGRILLDSRSSDIKSTSQVYKLYDGSGIRLILLGMRSICPIL